MLPVLPIFSNKALVPLIVLAALWAAVILYRGRSMPWPGSTWPRPPWFAILSLVFLVYGGASAIWSIDAATSITSLLRIAALFAMGHVLLALADAQGYRITNGFVRCLWIGVAVACVVIVSETVSGGLVVPLLRGKGAALPEYLLNHAVTILAIIGWLGVLLVHAHGGRWRAALLGAAVFATIAIAGSDSAFIALLIGVISLLVFLWGGYPARRIAAVAIAAGILVMPILVSQMANQRPVADAISGVSFSASHRLVIWDFAAQKIERRPLLGWGFESSRRLETATRDAASPDFLTPGGKKLSRMPLHPHNGPLQIWLELGLVGILLLVYLIAGLFGAVERCSLGKVEKAVICAMIVTACAVASLTFGIWQNWWVASFWMIAALTRAAMLGLAGMAPGMAPGKG